MAKFEVTKDEDGFVKKTLADIDFMTFTRIRDEHEELKARLATTEQEAYLVTAILVKLCPNGLPARCGKCKNKFYTYQVYEWLNDMLVCPGCATRAVGLFKATFFEGNNSVVENLGTLATRVVRLGEAVVAEQPNREFQSHLGSLKNYLYEIGIRA